jgi:DivIVA domain-containing protein
VGLTADQIRGHGFRQTLRGYAVGEVDELLDRIAEQVERTDRDVADLRQRLRATEARLAEALETEGTLKRTLLIAQQAAERTLDEARTEAAALRGEAEREVTDQLRVADARRAAVEEEAERVTVAANDAAAQRREAAEEEARRTLDDARTEAARVAEEAAADAGRVRAEAEAEAAQIREEAAVDAERLRSAARSEADERLAAASARCDELRDQAEELAAVAHGHRAHLRRLLEEQLALLDQA